MATSATTITAGNDGKYLFKAQAAAILVLKHDKPQGLTSVRTCPSKTDGAWRPAVQHYGSEVIVDLTASVYPVDVEVTVPDDATVSVAKVYSGSTVTNYNA